MKIDVIVWEVRMEVQILTLEKGEEADRLEYVTVCRMFQNELYKFESL
jgi:hypothetical protein